MPNIDTLIQTESQTLSTAPQETAYFTTLDSAGISVSP